MTVNLGGRFRKNAGIRTTAIGLGILAFQFDFVFERTRTQFARVHDMLVAGVTFLAAASGAVESRFTDKKNEAVNRQQKLLALEVSFGKDWTAASPDKKDEVQEIYIRNLLVI
jgi:hypothetical protein